MPHKDKHVLVIGGAGYIGSVLVGKLLDSGYRVRVLDALIYDNARALTDLKARAGFSFVHGDFCRQDTLKESMGGITDVVLLAALVGDPVCRKFPDLARRVNEFGTLDFIGRLGDFPLQKFIFMSTCSNYGIHEGSAPADESSALNPKSLYAETKVAVERQLLDPAAEFGCAVTVLRSATAYGISPRMRFDLTINEFTRVLALGRELVVYDADTWRPYCHIADISQAVMKVLDAERSKIDRQVFNVGDDGENVTKRMLVDYLMSLLPEARVRFRQGIVDPRDYRVSFGRISTSLDYHATYTLRAYLHELLDVIRMGRFDGVESDPGYYHNHEPRFDHH